MAFDPKAYIADQAAEEKMPVKKKAFNPAEYVAEPPQEEGLLKRWTRGAVASLPAAGGLIGGVLATPETFGVGTIPGVMAGAGVGRAAQKFIEPYLDEGYKPGLGAPKTKEEAIEFAKKQGEQALDIGQTALEAGAFEAGGQAVGAGINKLLSLRGAPVAKEALPEIEAAAERLGVKATPGMKTKDMMTQGLESSLEQSPSLAGQKVRSEIQPIKNKVQESLEGLLSEATPSSERAAVGGEIKKGIETRVQSRLGPIKEAYADLESHMGSIEVPQSSKDVASRIINSSDAARVNPQTASKFSTMLQNAENLNQVKLIRSDAIKIAMDDAASASEKAVAADVIKAADRMTERQAIVAAHEVAGPEGKGIAKGMLKQRQETNKAYKSLMGDLKFISERAGLGKGAEYGPETFLKQLREKFSAEEIPRKLFDAKDVEQLRKVKEVFPDQYEQARKLRLGEIADASKVKGEIRLSNFLKQIKGMSKESVQAIFGQDKQQAIKDFETIYNAGVDKIGPSGTPQGIMFMNIITSPVQELKEGLRYLVYKHRGGLIGKPAPEIPTSIFQKGLMNQPQGLMNQRGGLIGK